jgi:hypothetical protein
MVELVRLSMNDCRWTRPLPSEPTTHPHTSVARVVEVTVPTNSIASRVARHRHVARTDANGISHVQILGNKVDEKDGGSNERFPCGMTARDKCIEIRTSNAKRHVIALLLLYHTSKMFKMTFHAEGFFLRRRAAYGIGWKQPNPSSGWAVEKLLYRSEQGIAARLSHTNHGCFRHNSLLDDLCLCNADRDHCSTAVSIPSRLCTHV